MKVSVLLFAILSFFISRSYSQENRASQAGDGFNFSKFTDDRVNITPELDSLTSKEYKSHPEYGILPYNAPCKDCIELLQKRDESHRYFVKEGTKGKEFYAQSSYGRLSYTDGQGILRTIDSRMKPTAQRGVFKADNQPSPIRVNIPEKYTSLLNAGKELQVNRNVNIYIKHKDGSVTSLGEPDWSNYTAGDDGIIVHDFYPGIDLELQVGTGKIESFYRLNKPLKLTDGWLVIRDNMKVPQELVYDYSYCEKKEDNSYEGTLFINDKSGNHYFYIGTPAAYDENNEHDNAIKLNYQLSDNQIYDLYVPIDWMNDPQRSYPLIIDPFVSVISVFPQASITGSGYNAVCFTGGCTYNLPINIPAACTIADVIYSFNYRALGTCDIDSAAWDLTYAGCRSPSIGGQYHTCTIKLPGLCILKNLSCYADFMSCIPPPQCASYNIPMVLTFYRCTQPGAGCGFSCVNADTPWDMTVKGYYISVSAPNQTICQGSSVNLTAVADSGITPYTYTWYPGGLVGNPVSVSPAATTTYTVTARDCPALDTLTDSAQVTMVVTVNPNDNPGFTIDPNPACQSSPVAISGGGSAFDTCYNWTLTGGSPATVNNQQNFNVTYANAGTNNITLHWTSPASNCHFDSTLSITVKPGLTPAVTISVSPSNSICMGDNVTFTAIPAPTGTYQWQINGVDVPNETNLTFSDTTLQNGDTVTMVLNAGGVFCGPNPVTSNKIGMVVNPILAPNVTITVNPPGTLCPGSTVTFTADTTNGGQNPSYQWQLNNSNAGTNNITFSTNTLQTGDSVNVILTSNAPCPTTPTAISNKIGITVYPLVTVTTSGDTTVCPGQQVTICAVAADGTGGPYFYSWNNNAGTSNCPVVAPYTIGANVYTVSATDSCNSNPATGNVTVTVLEAPTASFSYSPTDISILTPKVNFYNQSLNATGWMWYFGDTSSTCGVDSSFLWNANYTYCLPGSYTVTLIDTNATGCRVSASQVIDIHDEYYFYIPNSFSPNGDGVNDYFAPQGTDALQSLPLIYTMTIYDRWGQRIFETDNTSIPWDGRADNGTKIAEAGVYVYLIRFQDSHYSDKQIVGSVTLVR